MHATEPQANSRDKQLASHDSRDMPAAERAITTAPTAREPDIALSSRAKYDARLAAGTSQSGRRQGGSDVAAAPSRGSRQRAARESIDRRGCGAWPDAVGLDVSVKAYPGRQTNARCRLMRRKLTEFSAPRGLAASTTGRGRRCRQRDGVPEQRAWDAMIFGTDTDTGVELEMRLYDLQAQTRRIRLKWRDSGAERLLLLVNDTHANRRVLRTLPGILQGSCQALNRASPSTWLAGSCAAPADRLRR